ncbi:olfactory receptor 7C1-like [Leptodactylus fuscus]|uniref:olfactory receptor 7C1-like n=1 Tax=Leptodactylus fuscus TaxID=238119 RepID=UPI003F4ECB29
MANQTFYFYIVTFSGSVEEQFLFFTLLFMLYIISIVWNITIFIVILLDERLQAPMYFFLCNLSFVDILYTSVTLPKLLDVIVTGDNRISISACLSQLCFFISLACVEIFLLTAMAYDRYVAICHPLHYVLLMKRRKCFQILASCWIIACSASVLVTISATTLEFCRSRNINHMFCDMKMLITLACSNKTKFEMMTYLETFLLGLCPFSLILLSYSKIILNIQKISSTGQRYKTFSTCTSHLTVLFIFYGTLFCMYMRPASENSEKLDLIFSVFYLGVTPTLNPLIYSLRNKDIKDAIRKKILLKL